MSLFLNCYFILQSYFNVSLRPVLNSSYILRALSHPKAGGAPADLGAVHPASRITSVASHAHAPYTLSLSRIYTHMPLELLARSQFMQAPVRCAHCTHTHTTHLRTNFRNYHEHHRAHRVSYHVDETKERWRRRNRLPSRAVLLHPCPRRHDQLHPSRARAPGLSCTLAFHWLNTEWMIAVTSVQLTTASLSPHMKL